MRRTVKAAETMVAAAHWTLDPAIDFLNHGSFGACPSPIREAQRRFQDQLEAEPARFMVRELEPLLDLARGRLAAFLGAAPADLAFVTNASMGICTVLASLDLSPGDELLTTDQAYPAVRNALERVAARTGARVIYAPAPFPLADEQALIQPVLALASPRTRLAILDHVGSQTALVWPIAHLVRALRERGIETLVDGAHAPGQVPVALDALGAAYYTGNCHKWLCAPKGAAFLHVRGDRQPAMVPLVTSHGMSSSRTDRSRFHLEFDWVGTGDPTPYLTVPAALDFMGTLLPGGWEALRMANQVLAVAGRDRLCAALGINEPCPTSLVGSMASVPLPPATAPASLRLTAAFSPTTFPALDPLQETLFAHGIEVPVFTWPAPPARVLRISAQLYNTPDQYDRLAKLVTAGLAVGV